jgi:gamma-glutamyltranspeptidase/glutathione hydrolase
VTHRIRAVAPILLILIVPAARADVFERHVVVAQEANAAEAGRAMLRKGGNAIDAAVATAFALAVTHPAAGNLGGGGFLVAHLAEGSEIVTIDFREAAPLKADERMYLDEDGRLRPKHRAGPRAAGVPGTVAGLALAHQNFGKRPWAECIAPAARLAGEGFAVSGPLARSLNAQLFSEAAGPDVPEDLGPQADRLADFPASVAAFRKPDGTPWNEGDRLVQPDLARTLERIAEHGAHDFYRGETARRIVAGMEPGGGLISLEDLDRYQARFRPPIRTTYRGFDVYGIGPPASGGTLVALMLNMLEPFDLKADGRGNPRTLHRITEAMRRAYFIRATRIADPDFVPIDTDRLTSKPFAAKLAATIGERATPSAELADFPIMAAEGHHTTHLSTLDAAGNAVALTYTLEEGYGSKAVVPGAGFLLNNEMGDFNLIPGRTDTAGRIGTKANRIAPGKRMLSSQAPTVVLKDGRVRLVTGSPGGRTIPNTVLWVVLDVLEFGLEPQEAVAAPRTHHPWFPDRLLLEGDRWPEGTREALEAMGHRVGRTAIQGDAHTIVVDPAGRIHGVPDPRRKTGRAAGD